MENACLVENGTPWVAGLHMTTVEALVHPEWPHHHRFKRSPTRPVAYAGG